MRKAGLVWLLLVASGCVISCSRQDTAGGTMETENSVAVRVLDSIGQPRSGVSAYVRPVWYLGNAQVKLSESQAFMTGIRDLKSDKDGWIRCDSLPLGRYRIEVRDSNTAAALEFEHRDSLNQETLLGLLLEPTGTIQGSVSLPEGAKDALLQIYGSDIKTRTDAMGSFELKGVPAGLVRVVASTSVQSSLLGEDLAQVRPGLTSRLGQVAPPTMATEDPLTWRYSSQLRVDTLVREWMIPLAETAMLTFKLKAPDFDFSLAMADGRDLRIADEFDNPLRFERVLWDTDKEKAIVRVAVPSSMLDSGATVTLRWGHSSAVEPDTSKLWDGVPDSVKNYLTQILVGNFENKVARTDLPKFLPEVAWYVRTSDTATTMNPAPYTDITKGIQSAAPGRTGNAFHATYTATQFHWVFLGMAIGVGEPLDFSSLDSVVFYAKGNGEISFAFDNLIGEGTKSWVHTPIDSVWTRYVILPTDFLPTDPESEVREWNVIQDSVTNISIFASKGNEFWLDDIMLYGVGVEDFR